MERTPSPALLGPMANPWLDLDLMGRLELFGMRSVYDEVLAAGTKRRHEPAGIVGDLLPSEIAEKQARPTRDQMTIAKLPLAKGIERFDCTGTPINEGLVNELATGNFAACQRNVVRISRLPEHTPVIVTTKRTFGEWPAFCGDAKMTTALLERPTHHCKTSETGNAPWRFGNRA